MAGARPAASMAMLQKAKVNYSVALVAQAGCVGRSVEQVVSAGRAARSQPMAEVGSEGNENENESVQAFDGKEGGGAGAEVLD